MLENIICTYTITFELTKQLYVILLGYQLLILRQ